MTERAADDVDWADLRAAAVTASRHAYAPYSRYPVGAAALTTHGRILTGCNVENASYGLVLCAECGVVSSLLGAGGKQAATGSRQSQSDGATESGPVLELTTKRELLVALSCVDQAGAAITPCGRCRQLLWEHAAPGMVVDGPDATPLLLTDLLPHAFGPANLVAANAGRAREEHVHEEQA